MNEKVFQHELRAAAKEFGFFWHKIQDMPRYKEGGFIPKKPFDIFAAWHGRAIAIETKMHKKPTAWPLSEMRPSQIDGLGLAHELGVLALVIVNVRYGQGPAKVNYASVIPWPALAADLDVGLGSYAPQFMSKFPRLRRQGGLWDMRPLIALAEGRKPEAEQPMTQAALFQ